MIQHNFLKHLLFLVVFTLFGGLLIAQDSKNSKSEKESNVTSMIKAKRFVFKAQSVHPTRGRVIQLNSEYDLKVSGDTVRSYLPYFGRAYSAPLDGRGGGIDFTSKDFEYNEKSRKKGGWDITIKPKDVNDVRELFLIVFDNGSASLRVSSTNKELISYNGYVQEK